MIQNEDFSLGRDSLEESSPNANIPGEEFVDFDIDALASNDRYGNDESYGWYVPIYYPMPTSYYIYNVVTPVEMNGTVFYNYQQLAVPDYSYSYDEITTNDTTASELNSMMSYPDFVSEQAEQVDENSSHEFSSEDNNSTDLNDGDTEEFLEESEEFFEQRYSSQLMAENSLRAGERNDEIKIRKDWLYLLSLSGKLRLKDRIPDVQTLPMITEEEAENNEIAEMSDEELESAVLGGALWKNSSSLIDKSDGDHEKEHRNDDAIEASYDNMSENKYQDRLGDKEFWDSMFNTIDEIESTEFTIESCFSGSSENELAIESSDNDIEEHNSNPAAFCRRKHKRLRLRNKDINTLPTIYEEDEPLESDEDIKNKSEKIEPNMENYNVVKEECVQQLFVESENDCGLAEATDEPGTSQKPKKKRFKGLRRLMSRLTSCFRKNKETPG